MIAKPSERPLFILSVATGYGGAERNIEVLLRRIPEQRRVVVFAGNAHHLEALERIQRPNLELHVADAAQTGFVERTARLLIRRFFALRPSAILSNTLDSLRILSRAASWLPGLDDISFFYVHDFLWFDYASLLASLPHATFLAPHRILFEWPDYMGRFILPEGGMRALVVPNPVELPAQEPGAPPPDSEFLHLATLNGFKGHSFLAEAAAILRESFPKIRVSSYGLRPDPQLYLEVLRKIERIGAAETLSLQEYVTDPSDLLRRSRAVLITSVSDNGGPETFGRTIIEAWAYRRPVIAFAAGAPAQLIRHEIDGLLVDEKDSIGLAKAIARLWLDENLADRLGQAGRERVLREFSAETVSRQLLAVLEGGWRPYFPALDAPVPRLPAGERVLFDVSLSLDIGWKTPIGMSRVESDVADELARFHEMEVVLVRREATRPGFRRLTGFELESLTNRYDGMAELAARELAATKPMPPQLHLKNSRPRLARLLSGPIGDLFRRDLSPVADAPDIQARPGDVLICVSNPWDNVAANVFRSLRAQGVRSVLVVHDLLVWEAPQWTSGRDPREYSDNMLGVFAEAEYLVALSNTTADVLKSAFSSIGKEPPPISVARPHGLSAATARFSGPPPGTAPGDLFVVYCSTIEVRKNHIMLLNLWDRLRGCLPPERLPLLLFVGRWGWQADTVRHALARNWRLAPHIRVLENVRDESLLWLYRNARFTVFPSFAEGFGLPVAESLRVGTPVIASNHPALVEATAGLMPAIDPYDLPAWQREIQSLCLDGTKLNALREKARLFVSAEPDELPRAVFAAARLCATANSKLA